MVGVAESFWPRLGESKVIVVTLSSIPCLGVRRHPDRTCSGAPEHTLPQGLQQAAEGFNPGSGPVRQVRKGAVPDLAVLPKGFAQEDSRRGVAVGDGGDVHDFYIQLINSNVRDNIILT